MAISPKHLEEAFQQEVDYFEQNFDRILANKKITKGQSISIDVPTGFNLSHFAILKSRYIQAGWSDVTYNSDQREGSWLSFKY
jgi:reverse gyrase